MAIGSKLKEILEERGITIKDFANQIGVPPTTLYSFINRDSKNAKMDLIIKICTALKIDVSDLLTFTEEINGETIEFTDITFLDSEYQVNLLLQELIKKKKISLQNSNKNAEEELRIKNDYLLNYFNSEQPFSDEEMEDIKRYAEFVKSKRNEPNYWEKLGKTIKIADSNKDKKEED